MPNERTWAFYTEPEIVDVRGAAVATRRKGAGEPVMYLHGAGLTRRWLPFHEHLSQTVDLIAPEHLGFGDTPMPDWLDGFDDLVIHYADFLDALELDTVHLVGHSLGGWIAAELAVFFPDRFCSLQLIAPGGLRGSFLNDPFRQDGSEALERVFNGHAEDFPEYLEGGDRVEEIIQDYSELTTLARLAWNPRYDPKLERRLPRVTTPTQVILPDEDRIMNATVMAKYASLVPGARLTQIPGDPIPTSHVPFVQEPRALANMLSEFITENAKG